MRDQLLRYHEFSLVYFFFSVLMCPFLLVAFIPLSIMCSKTAHLTRSHANHVILCFYGIFLFSFPFLPFTFSLLFFSFLLFLLVPGELENSRQEIGIGTGSNF
jgi:hypothetical protein